ncbi:hypothetical protein LZ30DRAFT_705317 [Colletotrichum cereale]|nr:hypothetical protein LZ30DRAFT_705317 [Colletotrichum cereale]
MYLSPSLLLGGTLRLRRNVRGDGPRRMHARLLVHPAAESKHCWKKAGSSAQSPALQACKGPGGSQGWCLLMIDVGQGPCGGSPPSCFSLSLSLSPPFLCILFSHYLIRTRVKFRDFVKEAAPPGRCNAGLHPWQTDRFHPSCQFTPDQVCCARVRRLRQETWSDGPETTGTKTSIATRISAVSRCPHQPQRGTNTLTSHGVSRARLKQYTQGAGNFEPPVALPPPHPAYAYYYSEPERDIHPYWVSEPTTPLARDTRDSTRLGTVNINSSRGVPCLLRPVATPVCGLSRICPLASRPRDSIAFFVLHRACDWSSTESTAKFRAAITSLVMLTLCREVERYTRRKKRVGTPKAS